ncbi:hypothetical protein HY493_03835 [Candidatus Woesearchaeota archaeon]|nr:hypothetical protein [Candidatus Woesearchaeota archaeon]
MTIVTPSGKVYGGFTPFSAEETQHVIGGKPVVQVFALDEIVFILDQGRRALASITGRAKRSVDETCSLSAEDRAFYVSPQANVEFLREKILRFEAGTALAHDAITILGEIFSTYVCSRDKSESDAADKAYALKKRLRVI